MVRYKVKNINGNKSEKVQNKIKHWIESRKHVTVVSINVWSDENMTYSTIVYVENEYHL